VDATLKSVKSVNEPFVLILGGKDKGGDFSILKSLLAKGVEKLLLLGKAAPVIRRQLSDLGDKLLDVNNLEEAVERGYAVLQKTGGVVLLAPGCASFDMFKNFEHRGEAFNQAVENLRMRLKHG
jgi:UDP-N-acetylmuramoylalanine--D-glutamate ligase